ncbi:hypothetical protein A6R68_09134 [Neotoma lepida]|uniref:DNA repair nuclease/redox regulator APEX1 n=1 Tax=Neotoma lepida TaxID=56216 RepID=A0A1A6G2Z6_NEOLE|nr:hypothetical protein A6R68_09134 [Neotoma lepida]
MLDPHLMHSTVSMAYLQHSSKTVQTISHSNVNSFPKDAWVKEEAPDILCLQETKCSENKLPAELQDLPGLTHQYWSAPSDKEGYSGEEEHDQEGRVIVAEFDSFVLVTAYVPNAGRGLVRLEYRQRWDEAFRKFLKDLASRKPLVLCGDLNVAHEEIDLRNPKGNKKNAGFTPQERQGFGELLQDVPLADSFRHLYPNTAYAYTFWTYMMNARSKNVDTTFDYMLMHLAFHIDRRLTDSTGNHGGTPTIRASQG